ncbi:MAG TPA: hypothetical protein VN229_00095 [Terriglobales bacterium]|nr:hypothetical protein [Terriglobales bacterium]
MTRICRQRFDDRQRQAVRQNTRKARYRLSVLPALLLVGMIGGMVAAANGARADSDPPPIPNAQPLTAPQIVELLTGRDYRFISYGRPLRGTTHWNSTSHTVSGTYVYAGIFSGSFQADWNVVGDKSCTRDDHQGLLCSSIYAYGPGFMEVTGDGKVLAVSVPK